MPDSVTLPFYDSTGNLLSDLHLCAVREDETAIQVRSEKEPSICLCEGTSYDYRLESKQYVLGDSLVVHPSRMLGEKHRGRIDTGVYAGLLTLQLLDAETGVCCAESTLEIRSRKLSYERDYPYMLEDIATRCSELLMELRSPVFQYFKPSDTDAAQTLVQRLSFLKVLIGSEGFQNALYRIIMMPNTVWKEDVEVIPVGQSRRIGRRETCQLAKGFRRVNLPESHPLKMRNVLHSLPEKIEVRDKRVSVDTPENRFVKHALETFQRTLEEMLEKLEKIARASDGWIVQEIRGLLDQLDETLTRSFFREIARPEFLPLGSPVLQRKEGYRDVLRVWLQFDLSARLCWRGGEDVYSAGKRDVATLYEYWVFFRLLDVVSEVFELDTPKSERLIVKTSDGFGLKLRAGRHTPLSGKCRVAGRELRLKLSYNRTFARHGAGRDGQYPAKGSWTERMRPDYTLSLWPAAFSEQEAERQEMISHVHFDAKYRIENLREVFGKDDAEMPGRALHDDLDREAKQEVSGVYKRADLLKMHAYRDAIRRTVGAYVLYPGTEAKEWRGFHEIVPGLGAFPLRPTDRGDGTDELKAFLLEIAQHVSNRASQREQQTYHTYRIHKEDPSDVVRESIPELDCAERVAPAEEIFVLHGWKKDEAHLEWVKQKGLYNYRTGTGQGSLRLHASVTGASYLLLHGDREYHRGGELFKIVSAGPRVMTRETLIKNDYPGRGSEPFYLVFDVAPLNDDDPLTKYDWDLRLIDGIESRRGSAIPDKGIPLNIFMKGAVLKNDV